MPANISMTSKAPDAAYYSNANLDDTGTGKASNPYAIINNASIQKAGRKRRSFRKTRGKRGTRGKKSKKVRKLRKTRRSRNSRH